MELGDPVYEIEATPRQDPVPREQPDKETVEPVPDREPVPA